ncbi:GABA-specific high-affinity permease [Aspergillus wentii]|nr:GABA-specific high-affinity permease [Aspergillus wentii]
MSDKMHPDMAATAASSTYDDSSLGEAGDKDLLAKMGYKQELRRQYTTVQIFAVAFSIMGLVPSISSTLAFNLPAGPVGMVWGWFTASIFILFVGLSLADMASAMPTAGGLYWWTHYFAGEKWKNPLSFLVGYSNTMGLVGGMCSTDYTLSLMILACVSIARDGEWSASRGTIYGVYVGIIIVHGLCSIYAGRIMPKIQTFCIFVNIALIVATVIALPVAKVTRGESLNSGKFVFGDLQNVTEWPTGWSFILSFLAPIWSIGFFDSCIHMSEEALHAAKSVPLGIIWSSGCACTLGFLVLSVVAATMNPDVNQTINSVFGQPMAQVYYDAMGKRGALGFMGVLVVSQFLIGLSLVTAASRQTWAFSRDGALPFSKFFRHVSKRVQYQPVRAVCGFVAVSIIFGLLCLINSVAANALFSLFVASNYIAWGVPILCRLVWGKERFVPGEFYTGILSKPIAIVACVWLLFGLILSMFPTTGPNPSPEDMNYTIVINGFVWLSAAGYYILFARKWYTGPKMTVDPREYQEHQE